MTDEPNLPFGNVSSFFSYVSDSGRTDWLGVKSDRCDNSEQNEKRQNGDLRKFEWWLGLRWGHGMQRPDFFERLHD